MWSKLKQLVDFVWWRHAAERALSQAFEAILPLLLAATGVLDLDWRAVLGLALGGALASLLMSLVNLPDPESLPPRIAVIYRLVRTAAAAIAAVIGTVAFNVFEYDWSTALSTIVLVVMTAWVKLAIKTPPEAVTITGTGVDVTRT